ARRVDGLPLALELAAALTKVLSPAQITRRLAESLDLLGGGGHDRPERQRTLRATLEWSYQLLDGGERRLFVRLGIFAASFDVAMAEMIAATTINQLQALVDKSMLQHANGRFVMLETLRAFALEGLAAEELEALRRRRFDFVLAQLARLPARPETDDLIPWARDIEPLLPDIRDSLGWGLEHEPVSAARAISRMRWLRSLNGRSEHRTWLERALTYRSS